MIFAAFCFEKSASAVSLTHKALTSCKTTRRSDNHKTQKKPAEMSTGTRQYGRTYLKFTNWSGTKKIHCAIQSAIIPKLNVVITNNIMNYVKSADLTGSAC